jgi:hypothetical protein
MAHLDSNYRDVAKRLRTVDKVAQKEMRAQLRTDLGPIIGQAKANASWSTRIPGAIGPQVTVKTVGVRVNRKKAPHGRVYEYGGRHPVFGNRDVWVPVPKRSYVRPAVQDNKLKVRRDLGQSIGRANKKAGF